jgi:hypothetical protein
MAIIVFLDSIAYIELSSCELVPTTIKIKTWVTDATIKALVYALLVYGKVLFCNQGSPEFVD